MRSQPGKRETHRSLAPSKAGKAREVLVATLAGAGKWDVISVQRCGVSFVLALGTIYGFRENRMQSSAAARQLRFLHREIVSIRTSGSAGRS